MGVRNVWVRTEESAIGCGGLVVGEGLIGSAPCKAGFTEVTVVLTSAERERDVSSRVPPLLRTYLEGRRVRDGRGRLSANSLGPAGGTACVAGPGYLRQRTTYHTQQPSPSIQPCPPWTGWWCSRPPKRADRRSVRETVASANGSRVLTS